MQRNKEEQETIITWNNAESEAEIYTFDKSLINRIEKLIVKGEPIVKVEEEDNGATYRMSKRAIKIRVPRKCSEEQKEMRKKVLERARKNIKGRAKDVEFN